MIGLLKFPNHWTLTFMQYVYCNFLQPAHIVVKVNKKNFFEPKNKYGEQMRRYSQTITATHREVTHLKNTLAGMVKVRCQHRFLDERELQTLWGSPRWSYHSVKPLATQIPWPGRQWKLHQFPLTLTFSKLCNYPRGINLRRNDKIHMHKTTSFTEDTTVTRTIISWNTLICFER